MGGLATRRGPPALLLLSREELPDVLPAELGAFHHGVTDAREHLSEAEADLTLTDLLGASFDPLGRLVHLGLVSRGRAPAGESHGREESRRHPCPETCSCHYAPPSEHSGSHLRPRSRAAFRVPIGGRRRSGRRVGRKSVENSSLVFMRR